MIKKIGSPEPIISTGTEDEVSKSHISRKSEKIKKDKTEVKTCQEKKEKK